MGQFEWLAQSIECGGIDLLRYPRLGHKKPSSSCLVSWKSHSAGICCQVCIPATLRPPCCEEAQASHRQRPRGERKRPGQPQLVQLRSQSCQWRTFISSPEDITWRRINQPGQFTEISPQAHDPKQANHSEVPANGTETRAAELPLQCPAQVLTRKTTFTPLTKFWVVCYATMENQNTQYTSKKWWLLLDKNIIASIWGGNVTSAP